MIITREARTIFFFIIVNCDFVAITQNLVKDNEMQMYVK